MKCKKENISKLEDKILIDYLSKYRIMSIMHTKHIYKIDWYFRKKLKACRKKLL